MPVQLYVLDGGQIDILDWSIYNPAAPAGTRRTLATPVYLVVHPDGTLVWDTGLGDELAGREPLLVEDHALFQVTDTVASQLASVGHPADGIDYLGLSHVHVDHTGNVGLFDGSTLLIQGEEYEAARATDEPSSLAKLPVTLLSGDHDVFGDGSVVVKRLPGHTIGHQALLVELEQTGAILLSGDVTHSLDSWRTNAIPTFNHDVAESERSLAQAREILDRHRASLWIQHDLDQYLGLRKVPEHYA
jgi:glyoxylase-like metal-dependent hydrolase (beta-lactamase superfamily II)